MYKGYTRQPSRRKMSFAPAAAYSDLLSLRSSGAMPAADMVAHSLAEVTSSTSNIPATFYSAAGYHAHNPQRDQHILKAEGSHIFAAVLTCKTTARGGYYLKQHLYSELKAQIRKQGGDPIKAIVAAISVLNTAFKNLHPFNPTVLEGVQLALAYVDQASRKLYLASTGQCRCVVGGRGQTGKIQLVADVGRENYATNPQEALNGSITSLTLTENVSTIALGSKGIWEELAAEKALLRLDHYYESAAGASQGSAAAHLTNFALHGVTQRLRSSHDLRMRSLQSVSSLQSLQSGDRSQYKFGDRQPVRRRRGDVHSDFTAVVLRLDWQGKLGDLQAALNPTNKIPASEVAKSLSSYSRWDLVRLHFLEFARESRAATKEKWHQLVHDAISNHHLLQSGQLETKAGEAVGKIVEMTADGSSQTHIRV